MTIEADQQCWIDGLPTEPGPYWIASSFAGEERWHCGYGELRADRHFTLPLGAGFTTYGFDFKHKPAPPLPEPPSE